MITITPEKLLRTVAQLAPEVEQQLQHGPKSQPDERALWIELSCCVLSSQVPYEMAVAVARRVDLATMLDHSNRACRKHLEAMLTDILIQPIEVNGRLRRYRFPRLRASQLAGAVEAVSKRFGGLSVLVQQGENPISVREWLVEDVPGFGPKQASMFIRNVGLSCDLAVLDRHTIEFMVLTSLCDRTPAGLSRLRHYEEQERILLDYASALGYSAGVVDWAIWIVMRAAKSLDRQ